MLGLAESRDRASKFLIGAAAGSASKTTEPASRWPPHAQQLTARSKTEIPREFVATIFPRIEIRRVKGTLSR
jgi:hypothetical protein